ncbi:hypothetical protein [Paraburkholderia sp. BCC1884]|uniref:hypothetical protein n=1 Tax=Paraburkholderia sp. BCC1884 TaxID=2562668 RepID=UPI001183F2C8|nr:hypothetical protein [Paraburkholderia sp. BCC1884]
MNISLRHTARWLSLAIAACATPAFAQNAAPAAPAQGNAPTTVAATGYGTDAQAPANRRATQRNGEQSLLGAPDAYGDDTPLGNTDDAQRNALMSEQRMTVLGGAQPAAGKRKAAAGNGPVRVAGQGGQPTTPDGMAGGAAKTTYADPYTSGKQAVYRSPW